MQPVLTRPLYLCLVAALLATGCAGKAKAPDPSDGTGGASAPAAAAATTDPKADFGGKTPEQALDHAIALSLETVYFDFDSYVLTGDAQNNLRNMSKALKADSSLKLQVEGHTDARGSNEYNLSLSLKRADAIKEFLLSEGVSNGSLVTTGLGEEKPAVEGQSEDAYSKNRRGEFRKIKDAP